MYTCLLFLIICLNFVNLSIQYVFSRRKWICFIWCLRHIVVLFLLWPRAAEKDTRVSRECFVATYHMEIIRGNDGVTWCWFFLFLNMTWWLLHKDIPFFSLPSQLSQVFRSDLSTDLSKCLNFYWLISSCWGLDAAPSGVMRGRKALWSFDLPGSSSAWQQIAV